MRGAPFTLQRLRGTQSKGCQAVEKFGFLEELKIPCGSPCLPVPESCSCHLARPPGGRQAHSLHPAPAGSGPRSTPVPVLMLAGPP